MTRWVTKRKRNLTWRFQISRDVPRASHIEQATVSVPFEKITVDKEFLAMILLFLPLMTTSESNVIFLQNESLEETKMKRGKLQILVL